jgi:hypothetical protein
VKSVLSQVLFETSQFDEATGEANCFLALTLYTNRLMQITAIHSVNIVTDVEVINFSPRTNSRYLSTPHMHNAVFNQFLPYTISLSLAQNCMLRVAIPARVRSVVSSRFFNSRTLTFYALVRTESTERSDMWRKNQSKWYRVKKNTQHMRTCRIKKYTVRLTEHACRT